MGGDRTDAGRTGGLMKQRDPDRVAARLRVVGGRLTADQLEALAALCRRYGRAEVHLTVRQGVEIPHVARAESAALEVELAEAGLDLGACGPRVRTVPACPAANCSHGVVDSQGLARALDGRFFGRGELPHKFKIAVSGCPNGCVKPQENDVGVGGARTQAFHEERCTACGVCVDACPVPGVLELTDDVLVCHDETCIHCGDCVDACPTGAWEDTGPGYAVFVGGRMGRRPRLGDRLPFVLRDEGAVLALVERTLAWYAREGRPRERFGDVLDRLGHDAFRAAVEPGVSTEPTGPRLTDPLHG